MTSRKRKHSSTFISDASRIVRTSRLSKQSLRTKRRRSILETLEPRQLLAGPQLIGIQPNEGDLIVEGSNLDTAPRVLTFRFDEDQVIDPGTFEGIQILRSGPDGTFETADDVEITPGSVTLGETRGNEVVVRFADMLPDDRYRINVYGFDDPGRDIIGLRNQNGELLVPRQGTLGTERVEFELRLGALIEAYVPQPVVRLSDGTLDQRRDEILIYFNDDALFLENDPFSGQPTERSVEHPRFYQLLLTNETVRTTDDTLYSPDRVIYDQATNTARLIFESDLNQLPGVPIGGGTFRLRVGTAVDNATDLIIEPTRLAIVPRVSSNLGVASDFQVEFVSKVFGESVGNRQIRFTDSGAGGLSVALVGATQDIVYDFGGQLPTAQELRDVTLATPAVDDVVSVAYAQGGVMGDGGGQVLPASLVDSQPLQMAAAGDTLLTATDVGVFGQTGSALLSSLVISESIDPQTYLIQLPGALTDPGRAATGGPNSGLVRAINEVFGPDVTDGVTEIEYNFQGIFAGGAGTGLPAQLNNITETQKRRIREAIALWSNYVGVQFRETKSSGVTFAVGVRDELLPVLGTERRDVPEINATLRIDTSFEQSAMVFDRQVAYGVNYGEDFFRKAMAGIGFLLGLERNDEVTSQTLMALDPNFLNETINPTSIVRPTDPFFPLFTSQQQTINSELDSKTIAEPLPNSFEGSEPVFPGAQDILHGQLLHRPDSIDVDLYRFEVVLQPGIDFGNLTVETFAERLPDSSLLDTALTLFQDKSASATTDFDLGTSLSVAVSSQLPGDLGNRSRIEFIQSDRGINDTEVKVRRILGDNGLPIGNAIEVDLPRRGPNVSGVTVGQVLDAINGDAFASTLFDLELTTGSRDADISGSNLGSFAPIRLAGGGTVPISRNDDYFSSDSLLTAKLSNGIYYIGVAASGNDQYDPSIPESGSGGKTQGDYELLIKFEPQVSKSDVIRDRDSDRVGVPGTAIDGDLDGTPGGVGNFWFQTRPLERILHVTSDGSGITPGQTVTITGASGVQRRFEFVLAGTSAKPGNIGIEFNSNSSAEQIANALADAVENGAAVLNVTVTVDVDRSTNPETAYMTFDGERSLAFSNNFSGISAFGRNLFVDKVASVVADGSLSQPFTNINGTSQASAFASTLPGDIVRIVGNGGQDNNPITLADNFAYLFGVSEVGGSVLPDGRHMDVPKGVTTMIDAGAAFKFRSAAINVGSNSLLSDRSGASLQILGTPRLLEITDPTPIGAPVRDAGVRELGGSGNVILTSTRDRSVDSAAAGNSPSPTNGNWGGVIFRRDFDNAQGRLNLENEGIFLEVINHADIRFGGGSNILINSVQQTVNPIQMVDTRPTVTFNRLTRNAGAAMSASPNAFLETRYQEPQFQQAGAFTADYLRVGPDIKQNLVVDNSINGLFIRTETVANQPARMITVAARIDDVDIVHYIAENIVIAGTPGGPIQDGFKPDLSRAGTQTSGGGSLADDNYEYRITFVDASGFESLPSDPTAPTAISGQSRTIQLLNLPVISSGSDYVTRRLYRFSPLSGEYRLVAQLNASGSTFTDNGSVTGGAVLDLNREGIRGRLDGSLVIDPNSVVKFRGARIELDHGTQLLAEGLAGRPIVFTSALDDRYGAGGSFDTNNDSGLPGGGALPKRGDWAGIYAGPTAHVSLDNATVAYGGGISFIEGGQSRGFAALELQQASARVTNSRFEYNDNAQDGSGPVGRNGRLAVTPATIYGRSTQPILVGNQFVDNYGSMIDLDLASMTDELLGDTGRQTGGIDLIVGLDDNYGPLIRRNLTDSIAGDVSGERQLNGLRIRGGELTAGSVWDDTDISHVLFDSVIVGNQVSGGALLLKSRPDESLVVKMTGRGTPNSATAGTGITATGSTGDIADRIGGTVQVVGLPGAPVVLTSLKDDTVGAGRKLDGTAQNDTNGDGFASRPDGNDWRSLLFDGLSNDRNTAVVLERELPTNAPPGLNSTVTNAEQLGNLAERPTASDDLLRLGFEVHGFISASGDIDTYSFTAAAGTQVWIDLDRTSVGLDTVLEVVDDFGNVIARSDNSFDEVDDPSLITTSDPDVLVGGLGNNDNPQIARWTNGEYYDYGSSNLRDAGLRVTLPGGVGTRSDYFIRIRAASVDPGDVAGGSTSGAYRFQVRLQEDQEFPGSVVRHADIRFANHGIHVQGLPGSSPLVGEAQENESADPFSPAVGNVFPISGGWDFPDEPRYGTNTYAGNDLLNGGLFNPFNVPNARPQNLGDLVDSKTGTISVGGSLSNVSDVDFYQLDIDRDGSMRNVRRSTTFDIDYAAGFDRPDTNLSVFYSPTGNPNFARLVLYGEASNVLEDLASPLSTELVGELLQRGSASEADPMIGPVSLPAGSYFIAVTESGRVPTELTNNRLVRRTPIESSVRIFDDHVESIGGTTAGSPRELDFVADISLGWSITTDRATDQGHQRPGSVLDASTDYSSAVSSGPAFPSQTVPNFNNDSAAEIRSANWNGTELQTVNGGAGTQANTPTRSSFNPNTILIAFKENVSPSARAFILDRRGLELDKQFESFDVVVVKTQPNVDILAEIAQLSQLPEVEYAEPDFIRQTDAIPNDPQFGPMWGLNNVGQTGGTPDADIDMPEAWDVFTGSSQTVIAVIDTGIDLTHPDLVGNLWVNPGEIPNDGIDNDGNGFIDDINGYDFLDGDAVPQDLDGHGTHVAGTTAAVGNNGIGVTGVNWDAQIMALRVCDVFCPSSAILGAIDYVTTMRSIFGINIAVSNNSYGGAFGSQAEFDAVNAHINAGVPFVAAAGNNAGNNDTFPQFPASYNLDGIISVAATDDDDLLAGFSNFGVTSVDVAAPGVDVLSTTLGGGVGLNSGTSMASPHVAGVVALLAGFDPNADVLQLKNAILLGADPLPNLFGTSVTGARLNAAGSLALLQVGGSADNESIRFDRSEEEGTLTSAAFDLTGYSAADLPRFYFDYFLDAAPNDDVIVQAFSNEQPTPVRLSVGFTNDGSWRQGIVGLNQFAGDTGIVIQFVYTADVANTTAEGLYLDNFVVGFAERGEMVLNAGLGRATFTQTFGGASGQYQLEIRPATEYSQPLVGGVLVERALEANPSLIDAVYLTFPSGRGIVPYETFTMDVLNTVTGFDETLTFQFQPTDTSLQNPSLVDPNAVRVAYSRNSPQSGGANSVTNAVITAIRNLPDHAFFDVAETDVQLVSAFDTNYRHGSQVTLIAPAGDQVGDGDTFKLSDGSRTVTFEFTTDSNVVFGNIGIPYTVGDSPAMIARQIIEVINSDVVQGNLSLRASTAGGEWDFNNPIVPDKAPTDALVALHGIAVGNFAGVAQAQDAPPAGTLLPKTSDGTLILSAIFNEGVGDSNTERTQGQVLVENNTISEVHAIGIWSDPGSRGVDPEDDRSVENNFLQLPPVGNSNLGGAINFPGLNDAVEGGLAPGLVAQNNIIDRAGFTAIKVDGDTRPFVLEWNQVIWTYLVNGQELASRGDMMVADGFTIAIDAGGTRVVFEFEDISGANTPFGSGVVGGDGWVDGHVPIYYRLAGGNAATYNPNLPAPVRNVGYTTHEMMMAIYESIQGSILVTNGMVELVRPTLGPSLTSTSGPLVQTIDRDPPPAYQRPFGGNFLDYENPAIYLEGVTGMYSSMAFQKTGAPNMLNLTTFGYQTDYNFITGETFDGPPPMMPIAEAPQPLAKIVNNTIRGSDGTEGAVLADGSLSRAVELPTAEPNDTIATAVDTKLETSHRGAYVADGVIGDHVGLLSQDQDVDFYKVELSVGDRLIVDIDTQLGSTTLASAIDNITSTIVVTSFASFPTNTPFDIDVGGEIMTVNGINGNLLTVGRSAAVAHAAGTVVSGPGRPDTSVRILNQVGVAQTLGFANGLPITVNDAGVAPTHLDPGSTVANPTVDTGNVFDPFVDFTALSSGTYYVAVSSAGNEGYDPNNLSGRTAGVGGTGNYRVGIEVLAPRSFVLSLDSHPLSPFGVELTNGNILGTTADGGPAGAPSLVGATFTLSQIPDYLIPTRPGDAYANVNADGNRVTFQYTNGTNSIVLANGNINIPILQDAAVGLTGGFRVPDIMRATANAINGYLNNPAMPNNEVGNGPDGRDGPITRVRAQALGGSYGDNVGIENFIRNVGTPLGIFGTADFTTGFGHDRRESGNTANIVPDGTFTDSRGTTELYVTIDNVAKIELSPAARAAGLKLGPDNTRTEALRFGNDDYATESDQVLIENGILVSSGASAAILNNVVVNTHQSIVKEESSVFGFGGRIDALNPDRSVKSGYVVAAGNATQYDEDRNTQIRSDVSWWINNAPGTVNRNPELDGSLSTDFRTGPSNIAGGDSDFNFVVRQPGTPGQSPGNFITLIGDDLLQDGAGGRFTPAPNSAIIDSAVDSIDPIVEFAVLNQLLGISTPPIFAPERDHSGQLRADEPTMAPPGGIGADVFKDRGALDRADFIGPTVSLDNPLDNDFERSDIDPSVSFVNRNAGVFTEFRILVQDLGDDSDPFVGSGIDDSTVAVPPINGLRRSGANIALFENDRLLEEGIDYTFSYDETRGVITLKPLAGIWRNDRSYRIQMNNQDRIVLLAPDANAVSDGDQISVIDANGGKIAFEFESGYSLFVPEAITLIVPQEGTNAGGLADGDLFQIDDGLNPVVVFEFNGGDTTLPNTVPIELPSRPTPTNATDLAVFLNEIANSIAAKIQQVIDDPNDNLDLDVDVRVIGDRVVIGAEPGTLVTTKASGLLQPARTLALNVPAAGVGIGGVVDGDSFVLSNGRSTLTFEFDSGNGLGNRTARVVSLIGLSTAQDVAVAIHDAVANSGLGLVPSIAADGVTVFLNLPVAGSATVTRGQLSAVGLSRTAADGDTIVITPVTPVGQTPVPVTLEIDRLDGSSVGVAMGNQPIEISRLTTADELAALVANAILGTPDGIEGINPDNVQVIPGGLLAVGGDTGLGFGVNSASMEVTGSPSVTESSTIEVFGPLFLNLPLVGGGGIRDGSVLVITDAAGTDVIFEFNLNNTPSTVPGSIQVAYDTFSTVDVVANNLVGVINTSNIGVSAVNLGLGRVSLGRIDQARVSIDGIPALGIPGLVGASLQPGIVQDGEILTIRQGTITVNYEFDSAVGGGGVARNNVAVVFQPGSKVEDVAASLAAAINNNKGGLDISAEVVIENGVPTGRVRLADRPGTLIDIRQAPNLNVTGVPGGATPILISPSFSPEQVKKAILTAINSISAQTGVTAQDRGGATLFIENGELVEGPVQSYFLPSIKDVLGNDLKPNRADGTTQFTILLPTVGLDFADAPDPRGLVPGQFPTLLANDGARHVVTPDLMLGSRVDAEPDAQVTANADGDDLFIEVSSVGTLFATQVSSGYAEILVSSLVNPIARDGDTITLTVGDRTRTLEFDIDGIYREENYAISPVDRTSPESIAEAVRLAIFESKLNASEVVTDGARVLVFADDEDGVSFVSDVNPVGNLARGVITPISVTVTGAGVLEAWIDFNADGDWNDPGEQIIDDTNANAVFGDVGVPFTRVFNVTVPDFITPPPVPTTTFARFRVSRDGGLGPNGLALSGEVEDYPVLIQSGRAPVVGPEQQVRIFNVQEDVALLALDATGTSTPNTDDNGLLFGITDPDGDSVAIYSQDVGVRTLTTPSGEVAGEVDLARDGTFTFLPASDFFGSVSFTARVTDVKPLAPQTELVSSIPVRVTINVQPVNDPPVAVNTPVLIETRINEDEPRTFTAAELIDPFYVPGPANESDQTLLFQSVGSSQGPFTTELGGQVFISTDGQTVIYTPPSNFNSTTVRDRFTFTVADDPGPGQLSKVSATSGSVEILIDSVNDPPTANDDMFATPENQPLSIPIFGASGILANDTPGPQDEIDDGQTLVFVSHDATTNRGGTVIRQGDNLIYNPPFQFSGLDQFQYVVRDSLGAEATATVRIVVADENTGPIFVGINGNPGLDELTFFESKNEPQVFTYNLTSWFQDPENETMTYSVVSSNPSTVLASVTGETLRLELPSFRFGSVTLIVGATDASGNSTSVPITVLVTNTPDPPDVTGSLGPIVVDEDTVIERTLSDVFSDRDNDVLTYSVARLDSLLNPSAQAIANHPLVRSIEFIGDQLRIMLQPDQFGAAEIEIAATDGTFTVSDAFVLNVNPVPDRPVAKEDTYSVPVGAALQVLDPQLGLLGNDFDVDGDVLTVDVASIVGPSKGTLSVSPNGTFTYTSVSGQIGDQDSFTYRVLDGTGLASDQVTVTIDVTASRYQNPLPGLETDVNADGNTTAIDALRVINFLDRRLVNDTSLSVPVNEIGSPPPDFLDPNGDGRVSAQDALMVINRLAIINQPGGESPASLAVTTGFAAVNPTGLAVRQLDPVRMQESREEQPLDLVLAGGMEIVSAASSDVADWVAEDRKEATGQSVDEALSLLLDEISLG